MLKRAVRALRSADRVNPRNAGVFCWISSRCPATASTLSAIASTDGPVTVVLIEILKATVIPALPIHLSLRCAWLRCAVLGYAVLCCAVLRCALLCFALLCFARLGSAGLRFASLGYALLRVSCACSTGR